MILDTVREQTLALAPAGCSAAGASGGIVRGVSHHLVPAVDAAAIVCGVPASDGNAASDWVPSGSVTVRVPGKVNLYLGVGDLRDDGYHELTTVFHAVSLHDEVSVARWDGWQVVPAGTYADGIPTDEVNRVFVPFHQYGDQNRNTSGVGLGLSVASGFVTAVGGTLSVTTTPGGGATMVVDLPVGEGS